MYLYTDEIEFAQFVSEEDRRSRSVEIADPSEDAVPLPSPKSVYRLADKARCRLLRLTQDTRRLTNLHSMMSPR